jgi:hypothetical protein
MNDSDLIKRKNTLKGVLIGFGVIFILALGTMISLYTNKPFNPVLFIPCLVIAITLLPQFVIYNTIITEIKSRNI